MWNLLLVLGLLWSFSVLGTALLAALSAIAGQLKLRLAQQPPPRPLR